MLKNNVNNKPQTRSRVFGSNVLPHLSLNLHTMPQTANSHFQKWLFLGVIIFALMVIGAFLIFWQ